ncbi:uncharacterized protein LOC106670084 isoform X2 [Cimex lectularius]|uniref:AMOP domain-containing protein n=1 Tax=Cimex lectularius TaxID=79782 RepID=A0A8I6S2C3_CIMLE|nr:uncharacterized protein LOC106670084 isoform X2 [Cimex lectularius]
MKAVALLFLLLFALAASASAVGPRHPNPRGATSLQSKIHHLQETNKETIRHGKKKRMRMGGGRGKRKQKHGSARRYFEKQFLVQNRTLALLGDEVQRILHSTTKTFSRESPRPVRPVLKSSSHFYPERKNSSQRKFKNVTRRVKNQNRPGTGHNKGMKLLNTLNTNSSQAEEDEEERFKEPLDVVQFDKEEYDLDISSLKDDVQFNLNNALVHIISAIENFTSVHSEGMTPCDRLADCRQELQGIFLGPLPDCPCNYPTGIFYENRIWDQTQNKFFYWKDASNERLDIYKLGAEYCIRSQIDHGSTSLSAQHCCYDRKSELHLARRLCRVARQNRHPTLEALQRGFHQV